MPQHGIGRTAKVGKEQIIGLLTALELFVNEGDAARHRQWRFLAEALAAKLAGLPGATLAITGIGNVEEVPTVTLTLSKRARLRPRAGDCIAGRHAVGRCRPEPVR